MSEPLVIVGQGMAATRLVDELTQRALGRYSIIVIGAEPRRAYNRVLLSSLLAGEVSADDIELKSAGWWQGRGVTNVFGQSVFKIDRTAKCVVLENGRAIPYSRLVLATGSDPIMLPKPGMDLPGVIAFRRVEDVDALLRAAGAGKRASCRERNDSGADPDSSASDDFIGWFLRTALPHGERGNFADDKRGKFSAAELAKHLFRPEVRPHVGAQFSNHRVMVARLRAR